MKLLHDTPNGHTFIQVDKNGQNCILVYGGSNQMVTKEQINETLSNFGNGDYILLQNEINEISYIMQRAHDIGMNIIVNPSPFDEKIMKMPLKYVNFFLINEIEAKLLAEIDSDKNLLDCLVEKFPNSHFVMTVGSKGAYYAYKNIRYYQDIFDVKVVDTTAAGDTFTGYFLSSYLAGRNLQKCLKVASAASALAVSKFGAATSIPTKSEVENFLKKQSNLL